MTQVKYMSMADTKRFSKLFLDYLDNKKELEPFYEHAPTIEAFENYFDKFKEVNRTVLHDSLAAQHSSLELSALQEKNLSTLKDNNTFTVTTGHQLNIFCGPLFFIYKIVTTIKTCEVLKSKYPDKNFVPVYWMASEDHDFEEINHFHLFGKTHTWSTDQTGAVGRMQLQQLATILDEVKDVPAIFDVYKTANNLAEATREIAHHFFKSYGLLILDPDDKVLKQAFVPYIEKDVLQRTNEASVKTDTEALEALGYKGQIHPRAINFFYLDNDTRSRIVYEAERYKVLNTDLEWSEQEMQDLIKTAPEKFSPNVALRPLYQQVILPNITYIGGPGEIVYWLQLKTFFDENNVVFPSLLPRNFALYVNKGLVKKLNKLDLEVIDLFQSAQDLKKQHLEKQGVAFSLSEEALHIQALFDTIKSKANAIDKSLDGAVGAETQKTLKQIKNLEKRIQKAQEKQYEQGTNQVLNIQKKLFPNGGLQERHDNFLNFYVNDKQFIEKLTHNFQPFNHQFNLLLDD